jgi:hypothetical protein
LHGFTRARTPGRVVGVLAVVLAMLFGATVGAPVAHAAAHLLVTASHHDHSHAAGGDDSERQPLLLHADSEQVEIPEGASHVAAQLTTGAVTAPVTASGVTSSAGADTDLGPVRAVLQVWRT